MTQREIASFHVDYLQILNERGELVGELPQLPPDATRELYRKMVLIRELDRRAVNLQRQGKTGTYAPMEGQEACQVGSAYALREEDWVFPAFREQGVFLMRGIPVRALLLYFMGCEEANRVPLGNRTFPVSVPVASQLPLAVGCAMAIKYRKEPGIVATYFGDGATSEGDFSEAMNFATVYQVPVVFLCQNNQWAISMPRSQQTAARTLAQKAIAYEMPTLQVDGNDLFAVYEASRQAFERARRGEGPSFLELVTYRMQMHTTADDPKKYRSDAEVKQWEQRDPIKRLQRYLTKEKLIDEGSTKVIQEEAERLLQEELVLAEKIIQDVPIDAIFQYTYAEMPPHLKEQLEEMKRYATS